MKRYNVDEVKKQWSEDFVKGMQNRMVVGTYRYGKFQENRYSPTIIIVDALKRLKKYQLGGSKELLIDVANLCMITFEKDVRELVSEDDGDHVTYGER